MAKLIQGIAPRVTGSVALAMWLVAMGGHSALAQDDSFVRQRDAEAAKNGSTGFSISFADARRSFRPGETITLVFTFQRYDISAFNYEHCGGLGIADAVLDHSDGTVNPQADFETNGISGPNCGVRGGVRGAAFRSDGKAEPLPPITFAVYLNQAVRFDRPGAFRLYVRSGHRFLGGEGDHLLPPLISNILEFDVVERDRGWEAQTLEEAIRVLNSSSDETARTEAARSLSYLGTPEAVDEMAHRFGRHPHWGGPSDPDSGLDSHWRAGLYGGRDRAQVVARLERELDRTDRHVSPYFVTDVALLELTRRFASRPIERSAYESQVRSYSTRRLAALEAAGVLRRDLEHAFAVAAEEESSIRPYALTPGFADFPADVEAAFGTLTPIQQRGLLIERRNWTVLRDPAFVPMLRRLANATNAPGPQDIALRLLYDLAPPQGRQIALRELGKRGSSVGISGLDVLPDRQLPGFDNALVGWLELARTAEEYGQAMDRIERFSTGRTASRVRRVYERFKGARSCALAPAALAYFFRVAPGYARAEVGNVMREVGEGERCETGVMPAIAERRMGPALEKTAISHLSHSEGWVVADAATMLQQHGSARAEAPLWQALQRWHTRWKDRAAELEMEQDSPGGIPWEHENERYLTTALMEGTAWLLSEPSARRLTSLCVTRHCKETVEQGFHSSEVTSNLTIYPSQLPLGEPRLFAHEQTFVMLPSREALRRWLSLHETGTTFTWEENGPPNFEDVWFPGEATSYFEETRSFVESRRMTLMRRR